MRPRTGGELSLTHGSHLSEYKETNKQKKKRNWVEDVFQGVIRMLHQGIEDSKKKVVYKEEELQRKDGLISIDC